MTGTARLTWNAFLAVPLQVYPDPGRVELHLNRVRGMVQGAGSFRLYIVDGPCSGPAGRMAVGFNEALKDEAWRPCGYVGLFDVIEDFDCFSEMLTFAREQLRSQGVGTILFPFFKSTYFPYRFTAEGRDAFSVFLEFPDPASLRTLCAPAGLEVVYPASSLRTSNLDLLLEKNRLRYDQALEAGYSFRPFDMGRPREEFELIHGLSRRIFCKHPFYVDISAEEFFAFYEGALDYLDPALLRIALDPGGQAAGFSLTLPDYGTQPVSGLIIKSVGVLPEHRGRGIQGAWTYLDSMVAKQRNYDHVIGALIPDGNISRTVLGPGTRKKTYELYKL